MSLSRNYTTSAEVEEMAQAIRQRTRSLGILATVLVAVLALGACNSAAADQDFSMVNSLRANNGVAQLSRSGELNTKAQAQADRMASRAASTTRPTSLPGSARDGADR